MESRGSDGLTHCCGHYGPGHSDSCLKNKYSGGGGGGGGKKKGGGGGGGGGGGKKKGGGKGGKKPKYSPLYYALGN